VTALLLLALAAPGQDAITFARLGEFYVITAAHARASGTPRARGDRVEIPLADAKAAPASLHLDEDADISRIEIIAGDHPRLSIQLRHSRHTVELSAAATAIEQIEGGGLHVRIPRDARRAEAIAATTLAKTADVQPAAVPVAVPAPSASASASASAAPVPAAVAAPASAAVAAPASAAVAAPAAAPVAAPAPLGRPDTTPGLLQTAPARESGNSTTIVIVLLVCASAALIVWSRRKKAATPEAQSLRIIASRQLSPKVRLVLVDAAGHELLLAVSDRGARLITRCDSAAQPAASRDEAAPIQRMPPTSTSPHVSGLLKLRRDLPTLAESEAASGDPDADAEWARELLSATARAGHGDSL